VNEGREVNDSGSHRDRYAALGDVAAETWPPRYKAHKYWGRKPANVVSRYVEAFTDRGETVLDPFAGSSVSVVEAARLGRRALGFDLNPFAVRLGRAMTAPPDPAEFEREGRRVVSEAGALLGHLYRTRCPRCAGEARLRSVGYAGEAPVKVRFRCDPCRKAGEKAPDEADRALMKIAGAAPIDAPDRAMLFGWEMQKLKRRGVTRFADLFTARNLAAAAELRRAILRTGDPRCREWLLLTLTAGLAQFTRMIADSQGAAGGPSWKINCYWLPAKWQELNPLWYFESRAGKSLAAIVDLRAAGAPFPAARVEAADSRSLPLEDSSVDYVFTDPPYGGEGIQYGELSMLWCLWLDEEQALEREIAFNPHRKLDQAHYADGLRAAMGECHRVLRPGRWMTVTFANKDALVWEALMSACRKAGFSLETSIPMKRSAPALTETNAPRAPKADFLLCFRKAAR
jgi:adenine-specific DNA methylase